MSGVAPFTVALGGSQENTLVEKVRLLMEQDAAAALGSHMAGFASRQAFYGFRQPIKFHRPPEVDLGALMDLGS